MAAKNNIYSVYNVKHKLLGPHPSSTGQEDINIMPLNYVYMAVAIILILILHIKLYKPLHHPLPKYANKSLILEILITLDTSKLQ